MSRAYLDTAMNLLLLQLQLDWRIQTLIVATTLLFIGVGLISFKRWQTKRLLRSLPTVMWRPKFLAYRYGDAGKMPSSAITNVLPRMARLKGPYGCYGTVYGISTPVIHIAHPIPAHAVLQDAPPPSSQKGRRSSIAESSGASKAPAYNHFINFTGHGVFTADGEEWRAKRASVLHCLMRNGNRIETEAQRTAQTLTDNFLSQDGAVNIVPILQRSTLSLIYRYLTHTLPDSAVDSYLSAITKIRMILLAQSRSVWFLLPRWCYVWFSGMYRHEDEVMKPIRAFASRAVENAKPGSPLAQLKLKTSSHGSPQDLLDEAITLLFAGQDTGAATLSWTLHLLSLHPQVQDRLAQEVEGAKDFTKLPFLDAVLKESMRLYPVAPFVVRRLVQDVHMAEVTLPRNALACIWVYSLHRNPDVWQKDPHNFVPQRWLDGLSKLELASYMPFCAGPRNCLGQPMAHVWLRVMLGTLMQSVEFIDDRLQDNVDPKDLLQDMQAGFTVLPLGGVKLRMVARKKPPATGA